MSRGRIAIVASRPPSGEQGGAERFYRALCEALREAGADAEVVTEPSDESGFESILESYLRFYDLDLSGYDGVISTKAPSYALRHPNHVCFLVHTMRVFYDMFDHEFGHPTRELLAQRRRVRELDTESLRRLPPGRRFCIGNEVRRRLRCFNGLDATVLHMDLPFDGFRRGPYQHFFLPGRLHRWKRVGLAIEAFKRVERDVELKIAGTGEDEGIFRRLAAGDDRISFLGRVSDVELFDLYAGALAVPFLPLREDLGFITLEAFRSAKPVLTCTDAGEPAFFVDDGVNGFVRSPDASELARCMECWVDQPELAEEMGRRGFESIRHLSWPRVSETLLSALEM